MFSSNDYLYISEIRWEIVLTCVYLMWFYRDSKLTRLLQDSLSGNTRTIQVACLAPTVMHTLESMSTLQFAERAKNVKVSYTLSMDDLIVYS